MPGATEIYTCQPGQAIKEGKVDYSSLETRGEAEADAARRVKSDPTIAKIAYYAVTEDGDFKVLYTFDNPHAAKAPKPRPALDDEKGRRKVAASKPSLFGRIRAVFEED